MLIDQLFTTASIALAAGQALSDLLKNVRARGKLALGVRGVRSDNCC